MKVWKKEVASKDVKDTIKNRTEEADKILRVSGVKVMQNDFYFD